MMSESKPEELNPVIIAEKQTIIRELPVSDAVMDLVFVQIGLFCSSKSAGHGRINLSVAS